MDDRHSQKPLSQKQSGTIVKNGVINCWISILVNAQYCKLFMSSKRQYHHLKWWLMGCNWKKNWCDFWTVGPVSYEFTGYILLCIQWSLRWSYVCFTTTSMIYSWTGLLLRLYTTSQISNCSTCETVLSWDDNSCLLPSMPLNRLPDPKYPGQLTHWRMLLCLWGWDCSYFRTIQFLFQQYIKLLSELIPGSRLISEEELDHRTLIDYTLYEASIFRK